MSARAAWRLETLGYSNVHRYPSGKIDWLAAGFPTEGQFASERRIGALADHDVPTCRLGQRLSELDPRIELCVVINDERVVLGDLRGSALRGDSQTLVDDVMDPGPTTYRPHVSVREMAHDLLDSGARRVLVADSDGRLIGLLRREDVFRALDEQLQHHRDHQQHNASAHQQRADGPVLATLSE